MNNQTQMLIFMVEILGTISFASSGALVAIQNKLDFFGVAVIGVTTACGGGMMRDIILGINPPSMFIHPVYTITAIIVSNLIFILLYIKKDALSDEVGEVYDVCMTLFDTMGLGLFTVLGVNTALDRGHQQVFLLLFVGVITGVGGGLLRDILVQRKPVIFTKHIYAIASAIGALAYIIFLHNTTKMLAMLVSSMIIFLIRYCAITFNWNLPKIDLD